MHYVSWIAERSDFMKQKTVLGIDIGGTKVGIGLVTNKGKILKNGQKNYRKKFKNF